jgi:hypothetical protein
MWGVCLLLSVAAFPALMFPAVERSAALCITSERAPKPGVIQAIRVQVQFRRVLLKLTMIKRRNFIASLLAGHIFAFPATVTKGWDQNLATTAQTGVTRLGTLMLSTRQQISAHFKATPSVGVVCLATSFRRSLLPAKA